MVKHLRSLLLLLCFPVALSAQQDLQFTHFVYNKTVFNPAFAGLEPYIDLTGLYRNQWSGLIGSPESQTISGSMPLYEGNSGVGIFFVNDVLGAEQNLELKVMYAYHLNVGEKGRLSIGAQAGIMQKSLDGSKLRAPQGDYLDFTPINHNDDLIPTTRMGAMAPDLGLGVVYATDRFFGGVSVSHVVAPAFSYELPQSTLSIQYDPHINVTAGYDFDLSQEWTLTPAVLLKTDFVKIQTDINAVATYNDFLWGGLSLRGYNKPSLDAVAGLVGVKPATNLRVGYSYDYPLSALADVNSGSHEIIVNYRIPWERPSVGKIINNPRFLSY